MADTVGSAHLALVVVTPQKQAEAVNCAWVEIPATSGLMRALPDHAPTLGLLGEGAVRYAPAAGGAEQTVTVSGGFFEVLPDKVTVLADSAK